MIPSIKAEGFSRSKLALSIGTSAFSLLGETRASTVTCTQTVSSDSAEEFNRKEHFILVLKD